MDLGMKEPKSSVPTAGRISAMCLMTSDGYGKRYCVNSVCLNFDKKRVRQKIDTIVPIFWLKKFMQDIVVKAMLIARSRDKLLLAAGLIR